jgi:3,4-dihydroxy 2-butanone 4-phosphate synthase / GTP cyclohydrolase II
MTDLDLIATTDQILQEARNGRIIILIDDENSEHGGDLVVPAQMATPDAINFMATHARGLVCLALTEERVQQLNIVSMIERNRPRNNTAFTVSIEAREGVTTGISAADRARTIAAAINGSASDIVCPGHVFPIVAREGGVLVRAGHPEAAVDISRLAGLNPSGVICKIMNEDGTMSQADDLMRFAQAHGIKIATIRDLIAYRLRHDHLITSLGVGEFESRWGGKWKIATFWNSATKTEQTALIKGDVLDDEPTLVRMHAISPMADTLGEIGDRNGLLSRTMEMIGAAGNGVIVLLNRANQQGFGQFKLNRNPSESDHAEDAREYGTGAMVLSELKVGEIILLTSGHHDLVALEGFGIKIVEERRIEQI